MNNDYYQSEVNYFEFLSAEKAFAALAEVIAEAAKLEAEADRLELLAADLNGRPVECSTTKLERFGAEAALIAVERFAGEAREARSRSPRIELTRREAELGDYSSAQLREVLSAGSARAELALLEAARSLRRLSSELKFEAALAYIRGEGAFAELGDRSAWLNREREALASYKRAGAGRFEIRERLELERRIKAASLEGAFAYRPVEGECSTARLVDCSIDQSKATSRDRSIADNILRRISEVIAELK